MKYYVFKLYSNPKFIKWQIDIKKIKTCHRLTINTTTTFEKNDSCKWHNFAEVNAREN